MKNTRNLLFLMGVFPLLLVGGSTVAISDNSLSNVVVVRNISQLLNPISQEPGTIYRIQAKLNLSGQTVRVPEDCVLQFKKGEIKNGKIEFRNTRLEGKVKILCDFEGSTINDTIFTDWFIKGSKTDKQLSDMSRRIQSVFDLGAKHIVFGSGFYQFANVQVGDETVIEGKGTVVKPMVLQQDEYHFNFLKNVFYVADAKSFVVKNMEFRGTVSMTVLKSFMSDKIYGEPLIWVNKADKVEIDGCVFKNIENCTYSNKANTYYGKKQGSCVCLWDVSDASYINCEQVNCRHDEQVWIIAVDKPIMDTKVTYTGNYIHDMTPGPNSSAFTCVTGTCLIENNNVKRYNYPGSMFNVFAKKAIIRNNKVEDSYCSSVFDVCEYSYFHNDEVIVENNNVDAVNSVLLLGQSEKVSINNNVFRGLSLYFSANNRRPQNSTKGYQYWYSDAEGVLPTDAETIIDRNVCDFTAYDGTRSIAGTKADYGTGEILEAAKYNNVGSNYGCGILIHPNEAKAGSITITNNIFTSISSLDGVVDKNNIASLYPYTIKLINTQNATIKGNTFNGGYPLYNGPDEYTCIGIYNYPDVMEKLEMPGAISRNPSQYEKYIIEDNVFNVPDGKTFYPFSVYARTNTKRQTELKIKELVVRNNSLTGVKTKVPLARSTPKGTLYKQNGPVKVIKQVIE